MSKTISYQAKVNSRSLDDFKEEKVIVATASTRGYEYYTVKGTDGTTREVTKNKETGEWSCTCKHGSVFRFRTVPFPGVCWHIKHCMEVKK